MAGAMSGISMKGLNMAAVMKLPFVLIIENNQFAYSTPVTQAVRGGRNSPTGRAGTAFPAIRSTGQTYQRCTRPAQEAVDRARRGEGPTLIETITMRMHGHSASDDASYVPQEMIEEWKKKDPIEQFERILLNDRVLNEANQEADGSRRLQSEIEEAVQVCGMESPYPRRKRCRGRSLRP